jgi:hypothetical protein
VTLARMPEATPGLARYRLPAGSSATVTLGKT